MISADALARLDAFASKECFVSCDVGGTNVRLAIAHESTPLTLIEISKFQCDTVEGMKKELSLLGDLLRVKLNVCGAAIDVAGPVNHQNNTVDVTNYAPGQRHLNVAELPPLCFPPHKTVLLNDLEATCHGLLALSDRAELQEYFEPLRVDENDGAVRIEPGRHYVVAAVGTGLGVGLLLWLDGRHTVLPCEHGHVKMSGLGAECAAAADEARLFGYLSRRLYDGKHAPEFEDVVSGRGLVYCYEFACGDDDKQAEQLTPAQVAARAADKSDEACVRALLLHYQYLMRSCRALAIGVQARGVILCGDNQSHNQQFIREHRQQLLDAFLDTPKRGWIKDAAILTQTKSLNANLLGCARVAATSAAAAATTTTS